MYGLIIENLSEYIKLTYGEDKWEEIRRAAGIDQPSFSTHQVYPETLIPKLSKKAVEILQVSEKEFFEQVGVFFVNFVSQYGYDRVLSVLGRHMRDFLNGLDNLHEYLKFSYPRMRAPSFFCENETQNGLTLHYRSKRRGFVYYTMGQIKQVARHFYNKEMKIELTREEIRFDMVHVTFELRFDNRAFSSTPMSMTREEKHLPINASVLFEIFPFCLVFGDDMIVRSIGNSLMVIMPDLLGKQITNWFDLVRPLTEFKFTSILNRTNNIFELVTVEPILNNRIGTGGRQNQNRQLELLMSDEMDYYEEKNLRLKGQMIYMGNWGKMMYLGTPVMPDLNSLINSGLYINDLSMHDFSRDLMLAGTQQSVELKLALDQEQQKSKKLEESMRKLDEEMRRTDELLYQMIPKQVADRLRKGEDPIATCEDKIKLDNSFKSNCGKCTRYVKMFDSVSILFSDVVTFTEICSRITPMEVVSMLNQMYSIFDGLTERNRVYKVETIGDAYMVVSGAPSKETNHAERVCDMALDMVEAITDLKDPSTQQHLRIRVGVHTGAVVAGIVGLKMPRYCLFGDSVNTASRMESSSEAMKIHISQYTRECLPDAYTVRERGEIQIKGKGAMKTYWLEGRENRMPVPHLIETLTEPPPPPIAVKPTSEISISTAPLKSPSQATIRSVKYSPITFQDVRKSVVGSPIKLDINSRELRSNSDISHLSGWDPLRYFGSPIPACEYDDNERGNMSTAEYSPMHNQMSRLATATKRMERYRGQMPNDGSLPSSSNSSNTHVQKYQGAPLRKPAETNHVATVNGTSVQILEINSNMIQSHNDHNENGEPNCSSPLATPEFGRAMYKYSKKLSGKHNDCIFNHNDLPESKSDGELTAKDLMRSCIPNSKSQPNFHNRCPYHGHSHHHHYHHSQQQQQQQQQLHPDLQHQQCCAGFNATHRHKMQHNACSII